MPDRLDIIQTPHSSIAFYILSLFIDQVSNELVPSCYLITVLSHHSVVLQ